MQSEKARWSCVLIDFTVFGPRVKGILVTERIVKNGRNCTLRGDIRSEITLPELGSLWPL